MCQLILTISKLAKEIGGAKAAKELGIPEGTIHTWLKAVRAGKLDIGEGSHTPTSAMSLSEEITMLRKRVKEQDKEIRRLKDENEFLELTRSRYGIQSYAAIKDFAVLAKRYVPHVVMTVVDKVMPEDKIKRCRQICKDLGVTLRVRPFEN